MKRSVLGLCLMAVLCTWGTVVAQAQTCTGPAAEIISPTPGSTLQLNPDGSITFTWCNASADYFVIIESVPGAHDIFFAFTGGAGGGAGQNFLTLGPACAPVAPTGCIPALGETIFFTLDTVKSKQILGSFQYTFTAPGQAPPAPADTSIIVDNKSVTASTADQNLGLTATVSAASTVNQGTVTFQVKNGTTNVGAAVTSAVLTSGSASVTYLLPGGTAASTYTIQASYSGGTNFKPISGSGSLTVNPAPPIAAATTTAVDPKSAAFNIAGQNVTITAKVTAASAVNEGTVTFQVVDSATNPIGTAATSATLTNGNASAIYALPAGLGAADYTIQASYSGGSNFLASSGTGTLTVTAAPPPAQTDTLTTVGSVVATFSSGVQHVTLTAAVVPAVFGAIVNEGTVTFRVMDGIANVAIPSAVLTDGNAQVSYALPAGLAANATGYTIQADFSGGTNFLASSGSGTLVINKSPSTTTFTSAAPASLPFNGTYTPLATSTGDGTLTIGASGACSIAGGVVTITSSSGTCTVTATESEGANFLGSSATPQSIAAAKAPSTTTFTSTAPASLPLGGTYTPTATSTGDGTLTIGASGACSISGGVVTITSSSGTCTVTATESEGLNFLGSSATPQTITVTTSIGALMDQVAGLNLNAGNKNSLMSKLKAAQASLDRGNRLAATFQLGAFINEVRALNLSRRLDTATANSLMDQANEIIGEILGRGVNRVE